MTESALSLRDSAESDAVYRRHLVIQRFIDSWDEADRETASTLADELDFKFHPLARTVVIIPVAAHQERSTIFPALEQYARQETKEPFTVVLGMNAPFCANEANIEATLSELDRAQKAFPYLDVRSCFQSYFEPTIGLIRSDLWKAVTLLAARQNLIEGQKDVIGINHDIDLKFLPRHYIDRVQRYTSGYLKDIRPAYTASRHASDPRFPLLSRAVLWTDFMCRQFDVGYEASAIIPLTYYAKKGGFQAQQVTHEVGNLINDDIPKKALRAGTLQTSPRRYVERLKEHGLAKIWTEDSFGPNDACRDPEFLRRQADLSFDELERITMQLLIPNKSNLVGLPYHFLARASMKFEDGDTDERRAQIRAWASAEITRRRRLAARVALNLVGVPRLAEELAETEETALHDQQLAESAVNVIVNILQRDSNLS